MKRKRAKKNSDHRQGVSQSVFASPFFFFFFVLSRLLRFSFFFLFSFVFCLPLNLSIDTIALCLFQIYIYIYIDIISAAIKILTSIYYIKLSVFFIFFHYMKSFNLSFNPTEAVHITLLIIFHYLINNSIIYFKHKFKYN